MKKFYLISVAIITIGIILLGIGETNGGREDINNIHSGITTNIENFFNRNQTHAYSHHVPAKSRTFNVGKFSKINIDAEEPNIQIAKGDNFQIKVSGPNVKKISAKVHGEKLTISDNGAYEDGTYKVIVTVPEADSLKEITGSCSEGNVHLADLTVASINLQSEDGNITTDSIKTQEANFDLDNGDLKISNSTLTSSFLNMSEGDLIVTSSHFKIKATLGDGDAKINNSNLLDNSSFNLSEGDFQMSRSPKISYQLSTASDDDLVFHGNNHRKHFSNKLKGLPLLKVTSGDGDIVIN